MAVDRDGFERALEQQRARARAAWAGSGEAATERLWFELRERLGATDFLGYATEVAEAQVLALVKDGRTVEAQNLATGKYRTVFDVDLKQQGTYRIATVNKGLMVRWEGADGKPGGLRGAKPEDLATKVPKDAKNLQVSQSIGRIETFVTNGAPNDTALKSTGEGIELLPVTHPNDLFAGEAATFRMLVDGKPAAGLEFEITRGGTRYRNAQEEIKVTTDANGEFSVTWPEAGMYWLETGTQDDKTTVPQAKQRRLSYVATLEVLPQ